jgi:hypothetical protein
MRCGTENEDGATFCVGCGQRFPDRVAASSTQAVAGPAQAQPALYAAEMSSGAHAHLLTDVSLRDSTNRVVMIARKPSLLHPDYNLADGNEGVAGFIGTQTHLGHKTHSVEDANHVALGAVQVSNFSQNRAPPSCWLEDNAGNRLATIAYAEGLMAFSAVKTDGSVLFEASMSPGTGVRQALSELGHRAYAISLFEPGFPLPMLLATIVAMDAS